MPILIIPWAQVAALRPLPYNVLCALVAPRCSRTARSLWLGCSAWRLQGSVRIYMTNNLHHYNLNTEFPVVLVRRMKKLLVFEKITGWNLYRGVGWGLKGMGQISTCCPPHAAQKSPYWGVITGFFSRMSVVSHASSLHLLPAVQFLELALLSGFPLKAAKWERSWASKPVRLQPCPPSAPPSGCSSHLLSSLHRTQGLISERSRKCQQQWVTTFLVRGRARRSGCGCPLR